MKKCSLIISGFIDPRREDHIEINFSLSEEDINLYKKNIHHLVFQRYPWIKSGLPKFNAWVLLVDGKPKLSLEAPETDLKHPKPEGDRVRLTINIPEEK